MKKITLVFYLIANLSFINGLLSQSTPDSLFGGWKLIQISGGLGGYGHSNPNHNSIIFSSDCKFRAYLKGSLKSSANFYLIKSKSIYSSTDSIYHIQIEDKFPFWGSFTVNNKKLYVRDEIHDGFTHVYQRIYTREKIDQLLKKESY
ncbi:hypothetical protein [uncultured Maribacter sp.]|uniref:hypothetical protein n=1 Tax=uncultured Maribacter sp. TaxID=431308 RepID=UPI0026165991|nr:hypothetical protein [uncultured Maribacter sp.]